MKASEHAKKKRTAFPLGGRPFQQVVYGNMGAKHHKKARFRAKLIHGTDGNKRTATNGREGLTAQRRVKKESSSNSLLAQPTHLDLLQTKKMLHKGVGDPLCTFN